MRTLKLSYAAALSLAKESRPLICPNEGFERQLQLWQRCEYKVSLPESAPSFARTYLFGLNPVPTWTEKPAYQAWQAEPDGGLSTDGDAIKKARFGTIAGMVAEIGRKRTDEQQKSVTEENLGETAHSKE